jgi:hypothetical protein
MPLIRKCWLNIFFALTGRARVKRFLIVLLQAKLANCKLINRILAAVPLSLLRGFSRNFFHGIQEGVVPLSFFLALKRVLE